MMPLPGTKIEKGAAACMQVDSDSPLQVAIRAGNLHMVKLLWEHMSNQKHVGQLLLTTPYLLLQSGHVRWAKPSCAHLFSLSQGC